MLRKFIYFSFRIEHNNIALNKQTSLPSSAGNDSEKESSYQRRVSLKHSPVAQRYLGVHTLARRASCREGIMSTELDVRNKSNIMGRTKGRSAGSFNLGSTSPRSPQTPNFQDVMFSSRDLHVPGQTGLSRNKPSPFS